MSRDGILILHTKAAERLTDSQPNDVAVVVWIHFIMTLVFSLAQSFSRMIHCALRSLVYICSFRMQRLCGLQRCKTPFPIFLP